MFDFEKLHPNHKWAFLDGFLSGALTAALAYQFYKDWREQQEWKTLVEETTSFPVA